MSRSLIKDITLVSQQIKGKLIFWLTRQIGDLSRVYLPLSLWQLGLAPAGFGSTEEDVPYVQFQQCNTD